MSSLVWQSGPHRLWYDGGLGKHGTKDMCWNQYVYFHFLFSLLVHRCDTFRPSTQFPCAKNIKFVQLVLDKVQNIPMKCVSHGPSKDECEGCAVVTARKLALLMRGITY